MTMSNSMPSRPTLLTTPALTGIVPEGRPVSVSASVSDANPPARDAMALAFYVLLGFIMASLVYGLLPRL
jgi:hypothetical protein